MKKEDVKCPLCGTVSVDRERYETDGWMECEHCHAVMRPVKAAAAASGEDQEGIWQVIRPLPSGRRR